jgi:hypothetical protein
MMDENEMPETKKMMHGSIGNTGDETNYLIPKKMSPKSGIIFLKRKDQSHRKTIQFMVQLAVVLIAGIGIWNAISRMQGNNVDVTVTGDIHHPQGVAPTDMIQTCDAGPCFVESRIHVSQDRDGFPSFWKYAHTGSLDVTYDKRSLMINGERGLFLSGSLHPARLTKLTYHYALDEAVRNGLNMITIYVFWASHQPYPNEEIDFRFPESISCDAFSSETSDSCDWDLASAIRAAANRGLFVHIRIGPYVCAEYNYGGIPEWVALHKPEMAMRRPNKKWMDAMQTYVTKTVVYLTDERLFAYQGGPIIMGQIENELGGDVDPATDNLLVVDSEGKLHVGRDRGGQGSGSTIVRNATLQDYADWCGSLAQWLAPKVLWTMCNGLSAKNTIDTCNGVECNSWLESHGDSSRIQVDQPAILTEFEGGFQIWGEDPKHPSDYFWGRNARSMATDALKWFARGGVSLNYYMWAGGFNRGRDAGAGITNMYASDAVMCPSGQRHQPKFGHLEALHEALSDIAYTLLAAPSALAKPQTITHLSKNGDWVIGPDQRMYEYKIAADAFNHVLFVENDADSHVVVLVPFSKDEEPRRLELSAQSVTLLVDGMIRFDSASIDPRGMAFERKFAEAPDIPYLLDWAAWQEPAGASLNDTKTRTSNRPIEQTVLNVDSKVFSDYAWYETDFSIDVSVDQSTIFIDTQKASALMVFIDNVFLGSVDHHLHSEGNITLAANTGGLSKGPHTLRVLSESLGYSNLVGRWGGSTKAKEKGITGDVVLMASAGNQTFNTSLVDGREWRSFPGLHGEALSVTRAHLQSKLAPGASSLPTWSSALFDTPTFDPTIKSLFLDITTGRGHLWLNGKDLGRFWNITRDGSDSYSQQYYFLPNDYLQMDGNLNEIVIFDSYGGAVTSSAKLLLSWIEPTDTVNFLDEVDYPLACI